MESKKAEFTVTKNRWWLPGVGEMSEGGQKIQASSYKTSSGDVINSIVTLVVNTVLFLKVAETRS